MPLARLFASDYLQKEQKKIEHKLVRRPSDPLTTGDNAMLNKMTVKRCQNRGKNFTNSEELILLRLMRTHRHVLNNNNCCAETWKLKKEAWLSVEQQFAAKTGVHRSYVALRDKYRSLKIKLKDRKDTPPSLTSDRQLPETIEESQIAPNTLPPQIECGTFDIIEIEQACVQNNPVVPNANPIVGESISLTSRSQQLSREKQPQICATKRKRTLEEETIILIKLQQKFYQSENIRAAEMHQMKSELLELKKELLEVEIKMRTDACIKLEEDSS